MALIALIALMALIENHHPHIPAGRRRARLLAVPLLALAASLLAAPPAAGRAQPAPDDEESRPGEVSLPLKDYLALAGRAERAEQARAAARHRREPPLAEVVAQRTSVEIDFPPAAGAGGTGGLPGTHGAAAAASASGEGEARLVSELEVTVQGQPQAPVSLPLAGIATAIEVRSSGGAAAGVSAAGAAVSAAGPAAAATVDGGGAGGSGPGLFLIAAQPGRYTVRARSAARLAGARGESLLPLTRIVAPVAVMEIELPAGVDWRCADTVVVDERVEGGRRHLRLSAGRGLEPVLVLRRHVDGDEADALLVQDVVATVLQLRPEGLRRHDVVLYEVALGALADLLVDLPPGFEVERAGTDEGEVQPIVAGNRLVVHRQHRLRGSGYLVLTSRPAAGAGSLPLGLLAPQPAPRARYLAVATTIAGAVEPRPAASWTRVDLGDLPPALGSALAALDVTAAWRLQGEAPPPAGGLTLQVATAPRAAALETVVSRRQTTTLLTVDGTLLHRDRFELAQAGTALPLALPAGATLWSAAVDGAPVRPLARGVGSAAGGDPRGQSVLLVPLGGGARLVEVVAVLAKAIPKGRSRLGLDLAQVQAPVVEHRWRLLLPETARYRFRAGDLRPVRAASYRDFDDFRAIPAARDPWNVLQGAPALGTDRVNAGGNLSGQPSAADVITVTGESPLLDDKARRSARSRSAPSPRGAPAARDALAALNELRQGLVGGVRPLPVAIPETGKALLLDGVLPPVRVAVELEVRSGAR
jgi:hypothetical protein